MRKITVSLLASAFLLITACENPELAQISPLAGLVRAGSQYHDLQRSKDEEERQSEEAIAVVQAAEKGDVKSVQEQLSRAGDAKAKNRALLEAARSRQTQAARLLLDFGADVNARGEPDATPLMWASGKGHKETAQALLERGADIEAKGMLGWNPLLWATTEGHTEVVELLLAKCADLNAKTTEGETAIDLAARYERTTILQVLQQAQSRTSRCQVQTKDNT
jgi:ankyrin repeat protein